MSRAYSRKSVKDVETAAETIFPDSLGSGTLKKMNEGASKLTVTLNMHYDRPFDDTTEKRA